MKRLLCLIFALVLIVLMTGCMIAPDQTSSDTAGYSYRPPVQSVPASTAAPVQSLPVESEMPTEETETSETDSLTGVEMLLPEGLVATPGSPWVTVTVAFPKVTLTGPESERTCSLVLTLDGETVAEWPTLLLSAGQEKEVDLEFSFNRWQEDYSALLCATLSCGGSSLVRETEISVDNYPEEVYLAMSDDSFPYSIDVVRNQNVVIVYGRDGEDDYTIPVRVCVCSTGTATPVGNYSLGSKKEWASLYGGVWGQYVCGISGNILFHSVPYYHMSKDSLETEEYNKLGTACSMGCVRLPVVDVKWIYDNCPSGTAIHIYDTDELPVERPEFKTIDPDDPRAGWDPTDPDENNPWNENN